MFDFDVVTGPSELAKIARPDTRRRQDLPQGPVAQQAAMPEETKRKPADDGDPPHPHRE
jgi:hypothetical protein